MSVSTTSKKEKTKQICFWPSPLVHAVVMALVAAIVMRLTLITILSVSKQSGPQHPPSQINLNRLRLETNYELMIGSLSAGTLFDHIHAWLGAIADQCKRHVQAALIVWASFKVIEWRTCSLACMTVSIFGRGGSFTGAQHVSSTEIGRWRNHTCECHEHENDVLDYLERWARTRILNKKKVNGQHACWKNLSE